MISVERRGLLHLLLGGAAAAALSGVVAGMAMTAQRDTGLARFVTVLLVVASVALLARLLLATPVRAAAVALARVLLGVDLPDVGESRDLEGRVRGAVWCLLVTLVGGVCLFLLLLLVPAGLALVTLPWTGGTLRLAGRVLDVGGASWWLVPVGGLLVVAGPAAQLLGVALLTRWAPRWLGPTAGDRLHLEQERSLRLARAGAVARELHDSVGHALTAIGVQAEAGVAVGERDPAFTRRALADIRDTAHAAVGDLDRVLALLREEDDGPAPALTDVPELVRRLPGDRVRLEVAGRLDGLPAEISRTGFRLVQEAVTNAVRHGSGTVHCRVEIGRELVIEVTNPVTGQTRERYDGRGLRGMRERALLVGGTVESGPTATGWRVLARVPTSREGAR